MKDALMWLFFHSPFGLEIWSEFTKGMEGSWGSEGGVHGNLNHIPVFFTYTMCVVFTYSSCEGIEIVMAFVCLYSHVTVTAFLFPLSCQYI